MISFLKEAGEKLFGTKPEIAAAAAEPSSQDNLAKANEVAASAIGDYIRWHNTHAEPKRGFAINSKIRKPEWQANYRAKVPC